MLLLGTLLSPASGSSLGLRIQPYVQAVDSTSAMVLWKTAEAIGGRVEFGVTAAYGTSAEGEVIYPLRGGRPQLSIGFVVRAQLRGLKVGTLYHYRVLVPGPVSEDRTFRTAPANSNANVTFLAYGDSRSNPDAHALVVAAAAKVADPAFVLATGDAVPSDGSTLGDWVQQFFDPAEPLLRKAPFFVTRGNHDATSPFVSLCFEAPGGAPVGDYYSFDWGPVHVVTINTDATYAPGSEQYRFLAADLARATRPFKVFFGHHPAYSSGRHGSTRAVQEYLQPLFEANGVKLVVAGHDHSYERTVVNGVTYVVTGGGGAPLYSQDNLKKNPTSLVYRKAFNFIQVDASSSALNLTAWSVNGEGTALAEDRAVITP